MFLSLKTHKLRTAASLALLLLLLSSTIIQGAQAFKPIQELSNRIQNSASSSNRRAMGLYHQVQQQQQQDSTRISKSSSSRQQKNNGNNNPQALDELLVTLSHPIRV